MNKKFFIIFLLFIFALKNFAFTIYVVQSETNSEYSKLIESFKQRAQYDFLMFNLENKDNMIPDIVGQIQVQKPDAVLLIGDYAIKQLLQYINTTPVIITLFSKLPKEVVTKKNICGIASNFDSKDLLLYFSEVFPEINPLGLIFNVDKSLKYAQKFKVLAENNGLTVELGNIIKIDEIPMTIKMLKAAGVKGIWLGRDKTINSKKYFDELVKYSRKEKIPIIAMSNKNIQNGVCISITPDINDIGYTTGNLAIRLYNGELPEDIGFCSPEHFKIAYNKNLVKEFNIKISEKIKKIADKY